MAGKDDMLTPQEAADTFSGEWAAKFPPVLTVDLASELLHVPKATIYDWSSRGRLKSCARKAGKHLLIHRDKLLLLVFNQGINK